MLSMFTSDPTLTAKCLELGKCAPAFWWLDQPLGKLVFILFFITWGLLIVWLSMSILLMVRKLAKKKK